MHLQGDFRACSINCLKTNIDEVIKIVPSCRGVKDLSKRFNVENFHTLFHVIKTDFDRNSSGKHFTLRHVG